MGYSEQVYETLMPYVGKERLGEATDAILAIPDPVHESERLWREKAEANRLLIAERDSELSRLRPVHGAARGVVKTYDNSMGFAADRDCETFAIDRLRAALAAEPVPDETRACGFKHGDFVLPDEDSEPVPTPDEPPTMGAASAAQFLAEMQAESQGRIQAAFDRGRAVPTQITDELVCDVQYAYYEAAGITRRDQMHLSRRHLATALDAALNGEKR